MMCLRIVFKFPFLSGLSFSKICTTVLESPSLFGLNVSNMYTPYVAISMPYGSRRARDISLDSLNFE